jgi:hypothetical protein
MAIALKGAAEIPFGGSKFRGATASFGWLCLSGWPMSATGHLAFANGTNRFTVLQDAHHLRRAGWQRGHGERAEKEELSEEMGEAFQGVSL